jgi:ankyrin repeat protein
MPADTVLHKAAHNGDLNQLKTLLEADEPCNVNEPGASDRRALHRAAGGNHAEVCEYLISKGAVVDQVGIVHTRGASYSMLTLCTG